ncbi:MAG: hypothetical protein DMF06_14290 [Verrucomicrobia bacterium]|nr:MAG: hypothetical protein DMF06_14290 [Verrucomicrobiota bacterium]
MFAQNFTSAAPPYALPGDPSIASGSADYHPELIAPPRIYAEEIQAITSFFVNRERTPWSDFAVHIICQTIQIYYPSYNYIHWRFDGMTGVLLDRQIGLIGSLYDYQIYPSRDGSLWRVSILGSFFEIDPVTLEEIPDTRQDPAKYGAIKILVPLVDRAQNLAVLKTSSEGNNQIGVYDFTSGALVRRIPLSGAPVNIFAEDERRCYVLTSKNLLNLLDYTSGEILSTLKAPPVEAGALGSLLTWDRFLRRLLLYTWRASAIDGACLSSFAGFYPVPVAIGITQAIPLLPPRAGRTVPCLVRAYGDAGEGIPGVKFARAVTGPAGFTGAPPATDNDGDAIVSVMCAAMGSATIDLWATV